MSQSSSTAKDAARGQQHPLGWEVQASSAVDIRSQTSRGRGRPLIQRPADDTAGKARGLTSPDDLADTQTAACRQNYLQWAGFVAGTQDGNFGFGAYFIDDKPGDATGTPSSARMIGYTWTPSGRE